MRADRLGQELAIDDVVAVVKSNCLVIGKILRFTPKMTKIAPLDNSGHWRIKDEFASYTNDMVKVDQQIALIYLLKKGTGK